MVRNMSGPQETELVRLEKEYRQLQDQASAQAWELSLLRHASRDMKLHCVARK